MAISSDEIDFYTIEPRARAVALVGHYLQAWAFMEVRLDDAIAKALGLSGLQEHVLRSNLPFHNKLQVMHVLLDLSDLTKDDKDHYAHILNQIFGYSDDRNTVAHNVFAASTDGVKFLVFKAKRKLHFPNQVWETPMFLDKCRNIMRCAQEMKDIHDKIDRIRNSSRGMWAFAAQGLDNPYATFQATTPLTMRSLQSSENHSSEKT